MTKENNEITPEDLESGDAYVRLLAVRELGKGARIAPGRGVLSSQSLVESLRPRLHDKEPLVRAEAAWALGERGGDDAASPLVEALVSDTDKDVRVAAAAALGKQGGLEAEDALQRALNEDDDLDVRLEAVHALGQLASRPARRTLGEGEDSLQLALRQAAEDDGLAPALCRAARAQLDRMRFTASMGGRE